MEWLYFFFWFIVLSPLLPFVTLLATGVTVLVLQVIGAVVCRSV
jgi:hypothetical protein